MNDELISILARRHASPSLYIVQLRLWCDQVNPHHIQRATPKGLTMKLAAALELSDHADDVDLAGHPFDGFDHVPLERVVECVRVGQTSPVINTRRILGDHRRNSCLGGRIGQISCPTRSTLSSVALSELVSYQVRNCDLQFLGLRPTRFHVNKGSNGSCQH